LFFFFFFSGNLNFQELRGNIRKLKNIGLGNQETPKIQRNSCDSMAERFFTPPFRFGRLAQYE
jgi:hypothetical protein